MGPPKAACRDVRGRRYKPHRRRRRLVSASSYVTAVGARRAPTNRTALRSSPFLRSSCETVSSERLRDLPTTIQSMKRTALITGASSGIGEAFAEVFAAEGFNLAITARRDDRLQAVADRLRTKHGVRVDVFIADLSKREAVEQLCAEVAARGIQIDALVNNAGSGVPGSSAPPPGRRHDDFRRVLVTGGAELTYRLLPQMIDRGYGRIINAASLGGLVPAPAGHTLYG